MRRTRLDWLWLGAACLAQGLPSYADDHGLELDVRYRLETVTDDALPNDALASTLRTRLGYRTPHLHRLQAFIEFEDLRRLGDGYYNSTANGNVAFPVVADPPDNELNQAWLGWQGEDVSLRLGRQRINIGNQRFIGAVGFRQNEQTFDAVLLNAAGGDLQVGYIDRVHRIFGAHHPDPSLAETDTQVSFMEYERQIGKVAAGAYLHYMNFPDAPATSHRNVGVRAEARHGRFDWRAEYARQDPFRDGSRTNEASYYRVDLGWNFELLHLNVLREVLGGNGVYAFQTPLATLHAFAGVTDKFGVTPAGGIVDQALELSGRRAAWEYGLSRHCFQSDAGSVHYGDESAAWVQRSFVERLTLRFEVGKYSADAFAADTLKMWLTLSVRI